MKVIKTALLCFLCESIGSKVACWRCYIQIRTIKIHSDVDVFSQNLHVREIYGCVTHKTTDHVLLLKLVPYSSVNERKLLMRDQAIFNDSLITRLHTASKVYSKTGPGILQRIQSLSVDDRRYDRTNLLSKYHVCCVA